MQEKEDVFANQDELLLGVLTAIERDGNTSQRTMSRELGVALGLANAYLKRCVNKGLVKIKQVPRRRYVYYLTPRGFSEKARLTGQYLTVSFNFFRRAREQMSDLMADCARTGRSRVLLAGISELAEVALLSAQDHHITLVGVVDAAHSGEKFRGLPVVASIADSKDFDVVIVTNLSDPAAIFRAIEAEIGRGRVLAPRLLRLGFLANPEQVTLAAE